MKGLILAAGRGSRMKGLTDERPKCFVELHGRALLDWQLEALRGAGVDEIAIATGYRSESFTRTDVRYVHNARWSETNMVGTLMCAADWLRAGPCVVSYSDIVYRKEIVRALLGATADIAITYDTEWLAQWSARFDDPLSDAETFRLAPDGTLRDIGKRPGSLAEVEGQYMGLLRITPAGFATMEEVLRGADVDRLDVTRFLHALLGARVAIQAVPVRGGWFEVDSARDLEVARRGWT